MRYFGVGAHYYSRGRDSPARNMYFSLLSSSHRSYLKLNRHEIVNFTQYTRHRKFKVITTMAIRQPDEPRVMCSICGCRFAIPRFGIRGGSWMGAFGSSPIGSISSPLTYIVYLLPFLSYFAFSWL